MSNLPEISDKRRSQRAKIATKLRVRPSSGSAFEEVLMSQNVAKDGIYFHTHRADYRKGMRLLITFPFTYEGDPMKTDYVAEVVRVETLGEYRFGVAVHLLSTI